MLENCFNRKNKAIRTGTGVIIVKIKDLIKELESLPQDAEIGYLLTDRNEIEKEAIPVDGIYMMSQDIENFEGCEYYIR